MDITVTITDQEYGILESYLGVDMVQPWLQHCLDNKCRQRTDAAVLEYTNMNPKKMNRTDKLAELTKVELKQREDVVEDYTAESTTK